MQNIIITSSAIGTSPVIYKKFIGIIEDVTSNENKEVKKSKEVKDALSKAVKDYDNFHDNKYSHIVNKAVHHTW